MYILRSTKLASELCTLFLIVSASDNMRVHVTLEAQNRRPVLYDLYQIHDMYVKKKLDLGGIGPALSIRGRRSQFVKRISYFVKRISYLASRFPLPGSGPVPFCTRFSGCS